MSILILKSIVIFLLSLFDRFVYDKNGGGDEYHRIRCARRNGGFGGDEEFGKVNLFPRHFFGQIGRGHVCAFRTFAGGENGRSAVKVHIIYPSGKVRATPSKSPWRGVRLFRVIVIGHIVVNFHILLQQTRLFQEIRRGTPRQRRRKPKGSRARGKGVFSYFSSHSV